MAAWLGPALRLLKMIGRAFMIWRVFQSGRASQQAENAKELNKELQKNAEIDAKPVTPESAYGGLFNYGKKSRSDDSDA